MKQSLLFIVIFSLALTVSGQTTSFRYDNSGNRTSRTTVIGLKSTSGSSGEDQSNEFFSDQIEEHAILIYPNPVESEITVDVQGLEENADGSISIFDQSGRLILTRENIVSSNTINLSHLSDGTYIMIIRLKGENKKWTIIKE
jgi:YD repeat-containing protein